MCVSPENVMMLKVSCGFSPAQRELHGLFRFLDGKPPHRAGSVENKYQLLRRDVLRRGFGGRLQNHGEESAPAIAVRQNGVCHVLAGHVVLQHEVFIRKLRFVLQAQRRSVWSRPLDIDVVRQRPQKVNRHAGVESHLDRNIMPGPCAWRCDARRNSGGVPDAIGIGGPAAALFSDWPARDLTRRHHHREHELVGAFLVLQGLHIACGHGHLFSRPDIGDRLREDVGPFLIEQ